MVSARRSRRHVCFNLKHDVWHYWWITYGAGIFRLSFFQIYMWNFNLIEIDGFELFPPTRFFRTRTSNKLNQINQWENILSYPLWWTTINVRAHAFPHEIDSMFSFHHLNNSYKQQEQTASEKQTVFFLIIVSIRGGRGPRREYYMETTQTKVDVFKN